MSKTLETKRKILKLLQKKDMTITDLSNELSLSNATIGQHMDELMQMKAIEKIDNEHFRKLKYYKINYSNEEILKYLLGAVIIIAIVVSVYYFYTTNTSNKITLKVGNNIRKGNITINL